MKPFPHKTLALAVLSCMSFHTVAQTENSTKKSGDEIETIAVWGTQVKSSSLSMNKESMEIIQPDHISDLLRIIPGVDVGGAHSLNQRITIRSMDDKDIRISIDGANQNTYMYHHMGNLQIHADILESAEIDVGNNSVINGGLGGSVRFKTKDAVSLLESGNQFGARIQASYADNSGDSVALTGYGQLTESLDFLAYFNNVNRDNYEVGGGKILNQNNEVIANTDGTVRGLEGDIADALIKFGWDLNDDHRLKLGYETYEDKGDYSYRPDMGLATDLAIANSLNVPLTYPTEFTRDTTTLSYEGNFSSTTIEASVYANQSQFWRDELAYTRAPAVNQGNADNTGFSLLGKTQLLEGDVDSSLIYGIDNIQYKTQYIVDGAKESSEESQITAVFVENRLSTETPFSFIPGIRYEKANVDAHYVDDDFSAFTGALAIEYEANDQLLFRLSNTELFKAPELAEVFIGAGIDDIANPDIQAETGDNLQFSVAYEDAVLGADNFSTGFTAFKTNIDGYIYDYAENADGDYIKDNVGDMEIEGIEAYLGYDWKNLELLITFSNSESELDAFAEHTQFNDARIDREQGDTWSFSLDYEFTNWDLHLHWDTLKVDSLSAGPDLDGPTLLNSKEGYLVHNLSAIWKPTESFNLALGVENLNDEFYASQSSRTGVSFHPRFRELYLMDYEPGRNVKLTASYSF
jgi:hemoglobin/transferrin/lactoferrin receptor protein